MFPAIFRHYTWRWKKLNNSETRYAVLTNRMGKQLLPEHIYGFGSEPYKETVTQLECYKALLVFPAHTGPKNR